MAVMGRVKPVFKGRLNVPGAQFLPNTKPQIWDTGC